MFRRRPRRPFRRPLRRPPPPIPPRVRRALAEAHRAMERGQFGRAAAIFGGLADEARDRGAFAAAARTALQAAWAYLSADQVEAALERGRQGLRFLVRSGQVGRVPAALNRMEQALREKGYEAEAEALRREVEERLGEAGLSLEEARARALRVPRRGELPAKCPACGGPLRPDEVEWHDAQTAECPYCGSVVKAA